MTISSEQFKTSFTIQGISGEIFPTVFVFDKAEDLDVFIGTAKQVLGTNYSVTGGNGGVGSVVAVGIFTAGSTLLIIRVAPATQTKDYLENDPFPAEDHERTVDRAAMSDQASLRRSTTDGRIFDAAGDRVTNGADPVNAKDLTTKSYVDGLGPATPVTIPTPVDPGDDDKHIEASGGAYTLALPPFTKDDLPSAADGAASRILTATGFETMDFLDPASTVVLVPRNFLINGDFQVAQRKGTGGTHDSTTPHNNDDTNYVLDRWKILSEVAVDGVDVSHEQTIIPQGSTGAIKLEVETAGAPNNKFGIIQYITGVQAQQLLRDGASTVLTLSFKARTTAGLAVSNIRANILAFNGVVDSLPNDPVSGSWGVAGVDPILDGGFTRENVAVNLPVSVGSYASHAITATMASSSTTDNIAIMIWVDDIINAVDDVLFISDIQLEIAPTASQIVRRDLGTELRICQEYYAKTFPQATAVAQNAGVSSNVFTLATTLGDFRISFDYPVIMRAIPTIATFNPSAANNNARNNTDGTDTPVLAISTSDRSVTQRANPIDATDAENEMSIHITAESEL